ncbi:MAG: beta-galactosidase, partial [Prevotella sp.]|nr:beta-galactosidase [Prevotella sp.]
MKSKLIFFFLMLCSTSFAQQRQEIVLSDNWQFSHDRQQWQTVSVPHDWAIAGPFDKKWDLQVVRIEQNGEKEATEKSGRSGALPWIGEGYYRRNLPIPSDFKGRAELLFDGAMAEPTVFVNGKKAGYWAYGYNAFRVDITDFINTQSAQNLLEVSLQNLPESSRWYPGAGIYRPVTLILTGNSHIDDWGIYTQTIKIHQGTKDIAELSVEVPIVNKQPGMSVGLALFDADGKEIAHVMPAPMRNGKVSTRFLIPNAKLWSPENPYLYKLVAKLC